jgi:uroporphyrin-3 C-methyltransferase
MTASSTGPTSEDPAAVVSPAPAAPAQPASGPRKSVTRIAVSRPVFYGLAVLTVTSLIATGLLWQRLGGIQEQLARQSADAGANAIEARALAREARELARDTAARQAVGDTKLAEIAMQRTQLEDLMQSLSRSRDENVIVDIESALRLAQQQSQLTLSPEPLLAALRAADLRLSRGAQPRMARLRAAVARDVDRIKSAPLADVPAILVRLDEITRQVDELPVANAVGVQQSGAIPGNLPTGPAGWWQRALGMITEEARGLLRVSRIEQPEAMLLSPEQAFFLRENLKLKLLNARLSLLARQTELARSDLTAANAALARYFEPGRRMQAALGAITQLLGQLRNVDMPRIDETLALLDATAAGR